MGRWVAALLITLVGNAHAKRAEECTCFHTVILPARGATDIPYNTKLYRIDQVDDFEIFDPLDPSAKRTNRTGYRPTDTMTAKDEAPPAVPELASASIVVMAARPPKTETSTSDTIGTPAGIDQAPGLRPSDDNGERLEVDMIVIRGKFDSETVLVRVEITDGHGAQTILLPPNRLYCNPGFMVARGTATMKIVALDLAGNESPAVNVTANVDGTEANESDKCTFHRPMDDDHVRCGTGKMAAFVLGAMIFLVLLVGILVTVGIRRGRVPTLPGEPVSLLVAEGVIRIVLRVRAIASAVGIGAVVGLLALDYRTTAILIALVPIVQLCKLFNARVAMKRVEQPEAVAERRDDYLFIAGPFGAMWLRASARIFAAARRGNVPKSIQL